MKKVASALIAAVAGAPVVHAQKPPRPSIQREAQAAVKACQPYHKQIEAAEREKKLRKRILTALFYKESKCNPRAESKKKARGIGQQTPGGAAAVRRILRERGETPWFSYADAFDPAKSIRAAAELVAFGLDLCGGLAEAIRFYNTGHCGKPNAFSRAVLRLAAFIRFATEIEEPRS